MTTEVIDGIVVLVVALALVVAWLRKKAIRKIEDKVLGIMALWAQLGPFTNGGESALAMMAAIHTSKGVLEDKRLAEIVQGHAHAYDNDPPQWEQTRQLAHKRAYDIDQLFYARALLADKNKLREIYAYWMSKPIR